MKATEAKLLDFLKKSPQFVIPIYQRTYSWNEKECRQLWDDIVRCGSSDKIAVHFVGSIVYVESGLSQVTHQAPLLVIDGQQRLTSISLLLAALAKRVGDDEPFDGFSQRKIRNYYLSNPEEAGERRYKLQLSQTDKATLNAIIDEAAPPLSHSIRIQENYGLFTKLLNDKEVDLAGVCRGIAKLVVVDIALTRDQDNPQLIFESMNSTGKELSQADLIRNFILMGLDPELQTKLYEQFWRPMELEFGQQGYETYFDSFMRHYLTVRTREIPRIDEVYEAFKAFARVTRSDAPDDRQHIEGLVREIRAHSQDFCALALGKEQNEELKEAFGNLRELKVDVAYPFLLEAYHDHKAGLLSSGDLLTIVRMVEAYVFRRAICSIPTNSMNKTFGAFAKNIDKSKYLESAQAQFLLLRSYRRFPTDEEFEREFKIRDLYNLRVRMYWLARLENFERKERVAVGEFTIEHLMPQNENLSPEWQKDLGPNWKQIQEKWLHTLGNLTLTAYNSEFSDRPFQEKRDMPHVPKKSLKQSPLHLNEGLGMLDRWNEQTIQERANRLAGVAMRVWVAPKLSAEVLETYRPAATAQSNYSVEDHPHLLTAEMRPLFEAFRSAVLALDPCVTEEFMKLYVAYKAETNFVDIVPQASRLRLSLNMRFAELNDPKKIAKDVTDLGRWGNGDVEVGLNSLDELPYVLGLVRQSLDLQLGDDGSAS
jgi:hypothetical protein